MRYSFTLPAMAACLLSANTQLSAQQLTTAYAITSTEKGNFNWTDVKQIDFTTGTVTRSIFDSKQASFTVYNARTGKEIKPVTNANGVAANISAPVASLSAACAYDQRHNRLYYAPLFMNQLRYIDLNNQPKIYYFENENFTPVADLNNEANHITRMVIAADGDGYALSNDANHLIRFTTGRKPVITDLGALQDDAGNGERSIHAKTTGWGGDMIADAAGNLYVISAYRQVFKVNIQSKLAAWVAEIQGLPASFTTNGAVVDNDGNLIVSSANTAEGYYKVDMHSWQATRIDIKGTVFNASDLANGNLAFANDKSSIALINRAVIRNDKISMYPNPVANSWVNVNFNGKESGRFTIQLVDLGGKVISEKIAMVNGAQNVPAFLTTGLAKGPYMIKVLSNSKKAVFTDKLIVE
ncbi:T9SS type A sorting domain-containing protein [Longitalea arenae]|uniref:T9SS type A sorting domain-containing protein n=1 Tax=Longitalea arenae TaxID=2812558 RepID=UPI00196809B6|nr:T9SS type A sorting domain-containing protein [Longitalea arenae]